MGRIYPFHLMDVEDTDVEANLRACRLELKLKPFARWWKVE